MSVERPETAETRPPIPSGGKPRRPGTWRNLVVSMGLVFLVLLAWLALTPRPAPISRAEVNPAARAGQVAADAGFMVSVLQPPNPWRATSMSWDNSPQGLPTWRVGYHLGPDDMRYVALTQAKPGSQAPANEAWLADQVFEGSEAGERVVAGRTWRQFVAAGDPVRRSLVLPAGSGTELTTVLTGNLSFEDLASLAGTAREVPAAR